MSGDIMMKTFTSVFGLVFLLFIANIQPLISQESQESNSAKPVPVAKYLNMVAQGRSDEVRRILPDLMVMYPNDPGVRLLTGSILQNAFKATEIYENIVAEYPESEWADDSMWRIIQFYAIMGDTAKAQASLGEMRVNYPLSDFLVPSSDIVRSSVGLARARLRERNAKLNQIQNILDKANPGSKETNKETKTDKLKIKMPIEKAMKIENDSLENNSPVSPPALEIDNHENSSMINHEEKIETPKPAEQILKEQMKMQETVPKNDKEEQKMIDNDEKVIEEKIIDNTLPIGTGSGSYGLQVGIYAKKSDAESEKDKYIAQRMRCEVRKMENDKGSFYVVLIGNYSSLNSAKAAKMIVNEQCGCNPTVVEK
jgi:cell division protein FtsN